MNHARTYLEETREISKCIDPNAIEALAYELHSLEEKAGRLVCVGLGGGAANASHAANDFRKLCGIRSYCPTDHPAWFTATWNDEGPRETFLAYARLEKLGRDDAVFVFSVGGGTEDVSQGITTLVRASDTMGFKVFGVVGPEGGETRRYGDRVICIQAMERVTPHTESFQMVVLHCLVSHPLLQKKPTKW